jgi:cytochrome c-type biogenesis protein CcmE
MAQAALDKATTRPQSWEKDDARSEADLARLTKRRGRWKFLVGGVLILGSVLYLVISGTLSNAQYFITVESVLNDPEYIGQTVKVSGAVLGDSIVHILENEGEESRIEFTIANIPQEFEDLAAALNQSVNDPTAARMRVVYYGDFPDLLQHEAQAILTGELGADGIFYASELLLKCPSRFDEGGSSTTLGENHPDMP